MAREFTNDKVVSEMTRDGLQEHNLATDEVAKVSKRVADYSYNREGSGKDSFNRANRHNIQQKHSQKQRYYNKKFGNDLDKLKKYNVSRDKYGKKLERKESYMKNNKTKQEYKPYRERDLAVTRAVRTGGRVFFRRAEAMYSADDENNDAQRFMHDGRRVGKGALRYIHRKLSHPINRMRNSSYQRVKKQYARADNKKTRYERLADRHRFNLSMETAWQKELRANRAFQEMNAREKFKKKIQFKHAYRKKYEQTFVQIAKNQFNKAVKKSKQLIIKRTKTIVTVCGVLILIGMLFYALTSCVSMLTTFGTNAAANMAAGLFVTGFDSISDCDNYFSELLNDLQNDILEIEENNPGYDEYQYWVNGVMVEDAEAMIAYVTYNQIQLASFLSTKIPEYTIETAIPLMDDLFEKLFILEQEEVIERRQRPVLNPDGTTQLEPDGSAVMEWYDCHIWKTSLTSRTITEVMQEYLNDDEYSQYDTFCRSEGSLKIYGSPFAFEWHPYISSQFGYRNHPIEGKRKQHKGVDIAVPAGTKIYSIMEGTVITSAYSNSAGNWIVIKDKDGYVSKYMHCSTLLVGAGTQVKKGQLIATVGSTGNSTGNHLHLQIEDSQGNYINPLYICAEYGEEVSDQDE